MMVNLILIVSSLKRRQIKPIKKIIRNGELKNKIVKMNKVK